MSQKIVQCRVKNLCLFNLFLASHLTTLAFTNTGQEHIPREFLEEVLELSVEEPRDLHLFSLEEAKYKLQKYPFIQEVHLEKIFPDILLIECAIRKPLFELADYKQVGIDKEGYLFPMNAFYTPKKLPKVYLGLRRTTLDFAHRAIKLDQEELKLVLSLLKQLPQVKLIDISRIHDESLGKQEIVLTLPEERYVRLPYSGWARSLARLEQIPPPYKEIDLRYKNVALVR